MYESNTKENYDEWIGYLPTIKATGKASNIIFNNFFGGICISSIESLFIIESLIH